MMMIDDDDDDDDDDDNLIDDKNEIMIFHQGMMVKSNNENFIPIVLYFSFDVEATIFILIPLSVFASKQYQ